MPYRVSQPNSFDTFRQSKVRPNLECGSHPRAVASSILYVLRLCSEERSWRSVSLLLFFAYRLLANFFSFNSTSHSFCQINQQLPQIFYFSSKPFQDHVKGSKQIPSLLVTWAFCPHGCLVVKKTSSRQFQTLLRPVTVNVENHYAEHLLISKWKRLKSRGSQIARQLSLLNGKPIQSIL